MTENKNDFLVVPELPTERVRTFQGEEGEVELITFGEALKEILEIQRELRDNLIGKK